MSGLRTLGDQAYARTPSHRARLDRTRVSLTGREDWAIMWSGGKDSTALLDVCAELWDRGTVIMSDNGQDPEGRRELLDQWVRRAPQLLFVTRPSHPDDAKDRAAAVRLQQQLGVHGILLGLRQNESNYRRILLRSTAGSYTAAKKWGHYPVLCPIADWSAHDVWARIGSRTAPYWRIYDQPGIDRAHLRSPSSAVRDTPGREAASPVRADHNTEADDER